MFGVIWLVVRQAEYMPVGGRVPMCFPLPLGWTSKESCKLKFGFLFCSIVPKESLQPFHCPDLLMICPTESLQTSF